MLIDTNRAAAVICPDCSNAVVSSISAFSFSGGRSVKIKCPSKDCGGDCFTLSQKNKKIKISVQCAFCGDTHTISTDESRFWTKELITLPCPEAGISPFYLGQQDKVDEALTQCLAHVDKLFEVMNELCSIDEYLADSDEEDILYDILDELYFLQQKGELSCICGSDMLLINPLDGKILLSCPRCHRSKLFDTDEKTLAMVLNATAIVLGK